MVNKSKHTNKVPRFYIIISVAVLMVLSGCWLAYHFKRSTQTDIPYPNSVAPQVDSKAAADQVENFYQAYIKNVGKPDKQKLLVKGFGNNNLVFYTEYYKHGFDPITCSVAVPSKITVTPGPTGPVALIQVNATYPDNSMQKINATVVLHEGMEIDSILCPGDKGNLPPS